MLLGFIINPVTMYSFEQSAGNQPVFNTPVGSSETTRETYVKTSLYIWRYSPWNKKALTYLHNSRFNHNKPTIRQYSTLNNKEDNIKNLDYISIYKNFKQDRSRILREQKNKTGVYLLINNINRHTYVGSSVHLAARMKNYLNTAFLKSRQNMNMPIIKALLKYGQTNFSLLILEHVDVEVLAIKETFYITSILPYYNILKQGYSSLGYKHTEETKKLLSELAKNRTHTEETKGLIARALTGENNPFYNKSHSIESKRKMIEANSAYSVYIYNSLKELLVVFPSVLTIAKKIKANHATIVRTIKENTLFRGEWYFSNIPYNIEDKPKIKNWKSDESKTLTDDIINNTHIKRAVFVYDNNLNFISKYDGVTDAQRALNINHGTIKKYAKIGGAYQNYIFSFERLNK